MNLKIKPAPYLEGAVRAFPSKSYSIRAFFVAALGGKSLIVSASNSDDVNAARKIGSNLGAKIIRIDKNTWQVRAPGKKIKFPSKFNVRESGTALRFLLSLLALNNKDKKIIVDGIGTLRSRPNKPLLKVLRRAGARISGYANAESVPVTILPGKIKAGKVNIDGKLSSQFISSLLISLPLLDSDSTLTITGNNVVSMPYIDMTLSVLQAAGIRITRKSRQSFFIPGRQKFKGLKRFAVPPDYGLAAFIMAAGILCNSDVTIKGIGQDKLAQADKDILRVLKKMGARLKFSAGNIKIKGPQKLKGCQLNLINSPDLVPIVSVLALFAASPTRIYGIAHVRQKESDRITDLRKELLKTGADIREKKGELLIKPVAALKGAVILDPHHDHRLAMAFSVLGLRLGLKVKDIECVKKSYPKFLSDLRILKARFLT